jgi:hypothetical protein
MQNIKINQSPKYTIQNKNCSKTKNGMKKKNEGKLIMKNDEQFEDLNID